MKTSPYPGVAQSGRGTIASPTEGPSVAGAERAKSRLRAKLEANAALYAGLPASLPSRQVRRRAYLEGRSL